MSVNTKTVIYYFQRLREVIYHHSNTLEKLEGEIEVDESYFGGARKGNRGRGAAGKVPVFGLLKRNGKVYTVMIPDAKTNTLMPIIREKVKPDSIVYSDCWRAYNALDVSEFKHYRINHSKLFAISIITSMELRIFGIKLSGIYASLTGFLRSIFTSF